MQAYLNNYMDTSMPAYLHTYVGAGFHLIILPAGQCQLMPALQDLGGHVNV